ncbi:unnamed protein product [Urochloa decumbens]|uniref:60S ribosomal protein L13a n=1 Tax=Urochloa decumbens TaxID=240449 RepID=A0ABC9D9G1_9POAL
MVSGCVVVDARGHMMGRLASTVAKEILRGGAAVREEMALSGGLVRQKSRFLRKRMNTKPHSPPLPGAHLLARRPRHGPAQDRPWGGRARQAPGIRQAHLGNCWELEEKRKEKAKVAYDRKKQVAKLRVKAEKVAEEKLGSQLDVLAPVTY